MSDSHTATDVITYIGVPLAVLGVLPILYNTVATLAALSRIKRMLRQQSGLSHGSYLTRSDVVNRVIEVDLPRYAVRPWDRFTDGERYWRLSRKVSSIRGGSWTRFNWRVRVVGMERQRVEYADQLRQPQVEILFEELICYLLDLGAVPDPHGWRVLRSTGLWTPVGCALMMSPDGREKALTIAPPDGSDGHLSLAVVWREEWTVRGAGDLPPYWVRLMPAGEGVRFELKEVGQGEAQGQVEESTQVEGEGSASKGVRGEVGPEGESEQKGKKTAEDTTPAEVTSAQKSSLDSTATRSSLYSSHPITCQISADGIVTALSDANPPSPSPRADHLSPFNDAPPPYSSSSSLHNPTNTLYIEHLRIRPSSILTSPPSGVPPSTGTWFASLATAYGTSSQTILWHYKIPDSILLFARRETVPCGMLVLLDIVDESTTPEWLSQSAKQAEEENKARRLELLAARAREQRVAMEREMRCKDPVERGKMVRERMLREGEERLRDGRFPCHCSFCLLSKRLAKEMLTVSYSQRTHSARGSAQRNPHS